MGVDVINPSGAPLFIVLGHANEQELIRNWEATYETRIFTSGTSHIDALRATSGASLARPTSAAISTAKLLGIEMPPQLLGRADEVIE